jgi:hypothetical protein
MTIVVLEVKFNIPSTYPRSEERAREVYSTKKEKNIP